jgi:hypothetical protein
MQSRWPSTFSQLMARRVGRWLRLIALGLGWGLGLSLGLGLVAGPAAAQGLESALSPGLLTQSHAKLQDECAKCHVRFNPAGQDALCLDCHKPVAQDLRAKTGFHGRQKAQACRACHTDHKGREAAIAPIDTAHFDHTQTDWPLHEAHAAPKLACASCHLKGKPWSAAPQTCNGCHAKTDVHKGALGAACADCHTERSWKDAKFDHASTRFALKGKHIDVKCADCHPNARYKETPMGCVGCHQEDDKRKGHKGRYGERCESCHEAKGWKSITFNHDADTHYALKGKHRAVRCDACHTGSLYRDKLAPDCLACHRKDDKHKGTLGVACANCHVESSWKETARFDHDRSRFPLLGKHVDAKCEACHQRVPGSAPGSPPVYRDTPTACVACHLKDDKHAKTLGTACGACHGERTWTISRFDHDVTRFALRGGHAAKGVTCVACHRDAKSYRDTPHECIACHRKDDKHAGQLGTACANCHSDSRWTDVRFDHNRARFALIGAHVKVECKACHASPRYRDTPSTCVACHRKADVHKASLGEDCAACHNARHWSLAQFDHDKQTAYPLTGRHAKVACAACHRTAAPAGRKVAALEASCVSCHRNADPHDGSLGSRCEVCHQTSDWKNVSQRRLLLPPAKPGAPAAPPTPRGPP